MIRANFRFKIIEFVSITHLIISQKEETMLKTKTFIE